PLATFACWQLRIGSQVSVVQGLPSLQFGAGPPVQTPAWQTSAPLQALPSEQAVPFGRMLFWQLPLLHTSAVQALPSLQSALTLQPWQPGMGVWLQPEPALQASVVHALLSLQSGAAPGTQMPPTHVSKPLHTVASGHVVPFRTGTCWQPEIESQLSVV